MALDSQNSQRQKQSRLSVQITQIDHILAKPGPLDASNLPLAPVIRVFGASSLGKKACLYIHQVYPYFYVEYHGDLDSASVRTYTRRLTRSLNHAIALSLKRKPGSSNAIFIRAIVLVKGVHFYGFHSGYSPFLKIHIIDPGHIHRAVTILQSGTVMGTRFRTFENHLSYLLQFLCDFGLYGCGWLDLEDGWQRDALEQPEGTAEVQLNNTTFRASPHAQQSRMAVEIDAIAPHILNRHKVLERNLHFKLQIPAPPQPQEPVVLGVRELWEDERSRRLARGLDPTPEMPVDPSESSRGKGGDWVAEARWWQQLRKKIESDETYIAVSPSVWETRVMTAFQSVEALWDEKWRSSNPALQTPLEWNDQHHEMGDVQAEKEIAPSDINLELLSTQDISEAAEIEGQRVLYDDEEQSDEDVEYPEDEHEDDILSELGEETVEENPFEVSSAPTAGIDYTLKSPQELLNGSSRRKTPTTPTKMQNTGFDTDGTASDEETTPRPDSPTNKQEVVHGWASNGSDTPKKPVISSPKAELTFVTEEALINRQDAPKRIPLLTLAAARQRLDTSDPKHFPTAYRIATTVNRNRYEYSHPPPSNGILKATLSELGLPQKIYRAPFFSDDRDVPDKPREFAGLVYHLIGGAALDHWEGSPSVITPLVLSEEVPGWEYTSSPPARKEIQQWLTRHPMPNRSIPKGHSKSQVQEATPINIYGLSTLGIFKTTGSAGQNNITILSMELFVPTQGDNVPNAQEDRIAALSFAFQATDKIVEKGTILVQSFPKGTCRLALTDSEPIELVENELDLLNRAIDLVNDLGPDILTGWDVQRASWGYLDTRGKSYGLDIPELISRGPVSNVRTSLQWETRKTSTFKVAGRHVFNLWRLMRSEKALTSYTLENVVFHLLKKRTPFYSFSTLTEWYASEVASNLIRVLDYCSRRASFILELIDQCELVTKTAEFARVFGVDFFSVISRGSQFKVESFMFRLAKPENFVLISPSRRDVGRQNAAECMPLIMEPQSALYTSPLLVLDFQSLYPSVMIAYNFCYSTCLGRVRSFQGKNKFGVVPDLEVPPGFLSTLGSHVHVAPNGMIYVDADVRKGLFGRMLIELLETRVMVKQAQKAAGSDKGLRRILEARQLGLKYIANVTYGYTSATYSGRMPAVEIADSIVQSGRETLEKAIAFINGTKKWGAEVVYGDTDSLFVYLPGKTKDQAFQIGNEIASTITSHNPKPIKLKFEKVYFPCVLIAKKRYVGFKFENPDDVDPVFDAKGIETVRRDGVPAQRKMTENVLRMLFHTKDLSLIKQYCCRTWSDMLENRTSIQEFIFAKEIRMGTYSENIPPPPGAAVAARKMMHDPFNEPHYGERIPYVIARGVPGSRLTERAIDPLEMVNDGEIQVDVAYYISRVLIPPLERVLNLVGADIRQWFDEMAKPNVLDPPSPSKAMAELLLTPGRAGLGEHFSSMQCVICGSFAPEGLCYDCYKRPQETWARSLNRRRANDRHLLETHLTCVACTTSQNGDPIKCESIDCPWLYSRKRAEHLTGYLEEVEDLLWDLDHDPDDSSEEDDDYGYHCDQDHEGEEMDERGDESPDTFFEFTAEDEDTEISIDED